MAMNPNRTKETIKNDYISYLSSILSVRDDEIKRKVDAVLQKSEFVKGPYLEITPPFELGKSLHELTDVGIISQEFGVIANEVSYERPLYIHQEKAIRKITDEHRNVIIATGTGSGKTECYFYPILDVLMKQSAGGAMTSGVRALLLFPMNALANDQLKKLRQLLTHYPEITFGRYTGETTFKSEEEARRDYKEKYGCEALENECLSRKRMQSKPPHILLTNYAMLEYLLLRPDDSVFFDGAKASNWQFIVLDEAHTYKGANGTEIALLLRRLKERVYHHTKNKLRCIATSATLGNEDAKKALASFAEGIFGEPFDENDIVTSRRIKRDYLPGMRPYTSSEYRDISNAIQGLSEDEQSIYVYKALTNDRRILDIHQVLDKKPRRTEEVAEEVFSDLETYQERQDTLVNLIDLATLARPSINSSALLSARYHMFAKSLEGLFISFYPKIEVYLDHKESVKHMEYKIPVFELANCQRCNQEYIIGKIEQDYLCQLSSSDNPQFFMLSKEKFNIDTFETDEDDEIFENPDVEKMTKYVLCTACGYISPFGEDRKSCCKVSDSSKHMIIYKLEKHGNRHTNTCGRCGAISDSVLKRFLTANHPATFVLASSLYEMIPPRKKLSAQTSSDDFFGEGLESVNPEFEEERGRKLLVFSDNRQEAAFFGGYMNKKYNQLMWRRLILRELMKNRTGLHIDELVNRLIHSAENAGLFESDPTLSEKKIIAGKYVMQEYLAADRHTGLEGRGFVEVLPEKQIIKGSHWGLDAENTWLLFRILMDTFRNSRATFYPELINPTDDFFLPANHEAYFRKERSANWCSSNILGYMPSKGRNNKRILYIKKLLLKQGSNLDTIDSDAKKILDETYNVFANLESKSYFRKKSLGAREGEVYAINYKKWVLRYIDEKEIVYRCKICGKIYPYQIMNICPEFKCDGELEPICAEALRINDFNAKRLKEDRIIPMIAKEHTAQLSKSAAGNYQEAFEEGDINVLSSSTTFEMGVDVGELEATFLRNVPPETSNYIQRAGRAGRRTSSTAFSLTFARRNSHDLNFFNRPENIISGKIKPPYIDLANDKIAIRHVNSIIMAWFFKRHPIYFNDDVKAIVGEEGYPDIIEALRNELYAKPKDLLESILEVLTPSLANRMKISNWEFIDTLIGEDGSLTKTVDLRKHDLNYLDGILTKLNFEKRNNGSVIRLITTYEKEKTINFLASGGILPKYGFPIDVVKLDVLNNSPEAANIDLSRDLKIAITEFAPPGSVVANGKVWTSYSINTIPNKGWKTFNYYFCTAGCGRIAPTKNEIGVFGEKVEEEFQQCVCGGTMSIKQFIIPSFGFSTSYEDQPKPVGEDRPKHAYGTRTQFWNIGELDSYQEMERKSLNFSFLGKTTELEYSPNGKLVVMNRGINNAGLWVCGNCGYVAQIPMKGKHKNKYGRECYNSYLTNVSLGHFFSTDVMKIRLPQHKTKIEKEFVNSDGTLKKDVNLSVLYAILEGASDALGIARGDISGCMDYEHEYPTIILFDEASGGAGHVKHIFNNIQSIFEASLKHTNGTCGCSDETSCYGCLRNYGNQFEHDVLTRGGAKEYLSWLLYKRVGETDSEIQELGMDGAIINPKLSRSHKIQEAVNKKDGTGESASSTHPLSVMVQPIIDLDKEQTNEKTESIYQVISPEWIDCISYISEDEQAKEFVLELAQSGISAPNDTGLDIVSCGNGILCEAELIWEFEDKKIIVLLSEDAIFANKCRALGYKVFVIGEDEVQSLVDEITSLSKGES